MTSLHFDSLVLFHDPALRLLYHRWRGQHNMHRFRPAVEFVQHLLHQHAIESWVIDLNGLPNLGLEDQIWLSDEVLPTLAPLTHLRQLALVLSPNVYNQLAAETLLHQGQHHLRFDIQFFSDSVAALDWLINPTGLPAMPVTSRMVA
ncbi:hypothetical protein [Hymenobacter jeollabukensis]|uniref:STAS/SEC14 domain-containing protein n=1 Tax=Hymenobacter jeollabukensis TaxID=2025313 RepID=A0A5R8WUD5_9BACT|nr:hypothetical protein [Hymenobacter jeollabukensis]TLM95378.1 hypothetical protein FDY95_06200 [Hymenobacter jeollabukensis]